MKVLLATFWHLPQAGGVSAYIEQLKRGLEKQGHKVDVFAQGSGPDGPFFQMVNTKKRLERYKIANSISALMEAIYYKRGIRADAWMKQYEIDRYSYECAVHYFNLAQYDVIHTHDVVSTRAMARVKPSHTPLIATIHGCLTREMGVDRGDLLSWDYYAALEYYGLTSADTATLVPTEWLKNVYARQFSVPAENMTVIPYGMEIAAFQKEAAKETKAIVPKDRTVIVCPARLSHVKGHYTLLYALAKLKKIRTDWVCLFLGDGPLRETLKQNCQLLNLQDHVVFMGDRPDVPAILKQADVFVLASLWDNHPFAVMEAQVSGKAVVVSDAGGIPEMVSHGKTGLIAPAGRPDPLAANLARVIADKSLREHLGRNARKWGMQKWGLQTMIKRIETIYANALKERPTPRFTSRPMHNVLRFPKQIEQNVWRRILSTLPPHYHVPDSQFMKVIEKHYE